MADDIDSRYAYIWDSGLWNAYNRNCKDIRDNRSDCVTPRGVLSRIYRIVASPSTVADKDVVSS